MKAQFKALTMACMMAVGTIAAAPAFAVSASPTNTTFTAQGATSLSVAGLGNIPCQSNFVLVTDAAGNVTVTQATFSGTSSLCGSLHASNLPWSVTLVDTTHATINNVTVGVSIISCSGNVATTVNNSLSQITLTGSVGACGVSGTLQVAPAFSLH